MLRLRKGSIHKRERLAIAPKANSTRNYRENRSTSRTLLQNLLTTTKDSRFNTMREFMSTEQHQKAKKAFFLKSIAQEVHRPRRSSKRVPYKGLNKDLSFSCTQRRNQKFIQTDRSFSFKKMMQGDEISRKFLSKGYRVPKVMKASRIDEKISSRIREGEKFLNFFGRF